jgi:microcompartment protein CcmK/EutM
MRRNVTVAMLMGIAGVVGSIEFGVRQPALAGQKLSHVVSVDTTNRHAAGSMGSARNSGDSR